jgi:hypothetical protein
LRNDDADADELLAAAGAAGLAGFCEAAESEGDGSSPPSRDSSRERLWPLIRAHSRRRPRVQAG